MDYGKLFESINANHGRFIQHTMIAIHSAHILLCFACSQQPQRTGNAKRLDDNCYWASSRCHQRRPPRSEKKGRLPFPIPTTRRRYMARVEVTCCATNYPPQAVRHDARTSNMVQSLSGPINQRDYEESPSRRRSSLEEEGPPSRSYRRSSFEEGGKCRVLCVAERFGSKTTEKASRQPFLSQFRSISTQSGPKKGLNSPKIVEHVLAT